MVTDERDVQVDVDICATRDRFAGLKGNILEIKVKTITEENRTTGVGTRGWTVTDVKLTREKIRDRKAQLT
jgi:hypothetical protein